MARSTKEGGGAHLFERDLKKGTQPHSVSGGG